MMNWVKGFQRVSNAINRRQEIAGQRSNPDGGEQEDVAPEAPEVKTEHVTNRPNKSVITPFKLFVT